MHFIATMLRISPLVEIEVISRSFAYVDFATPDAKVVAITLSERNLDGRRLLIKDGTLLLQSPSFVFDLIGN